MMLRKTPVALLFYFVCTHLIAETDLATIEEQERAQIISELTYRLDTNQNCSAKLIWDDAGSGADLDGYFFLPEVGHSEYMIGGHASQKRRSKYHCVTTVSEVPDNPKGTPPLLVPPADWQQVWKDSGSGATRDGSFWKAIPPDNNYVCLGSVVQLNHNAKPNLTNYRCVHKSLTDKIVSHNIVWSDKGSGADKQVTILNLPTTTTFVAIASRTDKAEVYDLKKNASSVPDAKMVDEILAKRMAPLKADVVAKAKALREQEEAAKKAEEEKLAAAKKAEKMAKQKKLVAAEEKKIQEEARKKTEEKALAEKQAEQKRQEAVAAEKLKEAQQARIAKAITEKETAEKLKKTEKQDQSKDNKIIEEQSIKEKTVKESDPDVVQESILSTEEVDMEMNETTSAKTSKSGSKGLNDLLTFFLKIFGLMIGGVIIFMIAFKVLFGKKASSTP